MTALRTGRPFRASPTAHAVRVGLGRGWTEFRLSLRSPQDQGFYLFTGLLVLGYLLLNRGDEVAGTGLTQPQVAMPSILGALIVYGAVIGPAFTLVMEREDGTLLRARAVPHGVAGYVTGQVLYHSLGLAPLLLVVLVPGMLLFDGLMHRGVTGWLTVLWVLALGLLATLPIGIAMGSLLRNVQQTSTWGMLGFSTLLTISGIFFPVAALWGWVQAIAQLFPLYWLGLGMRSAFLPDAALAIEIGGSWRTAQTVAVLAVWAVAGALAAPVVLRRAARRQSGAAVQQAREDSVQWVR